MKILHLVPTLSAGGAETFVANLAIAQRELGHEVSVFLLAGTRGARGDALHVGLEAAGVKCLGTTPRSARSPMNAVKLFQHIVSGRPDVVHAHLFSIELILAGLIPLLSVMRAKPLLVRTLHNSNIYGTRSRVLASLLSRSFDWNFACGNKVLINYTEIFGPSWASVIENGVTIASKADNVTPMGVRQSLGLLADDYVVACIGAFRGASLATSQKAQDVAIRAFHSALARDSSAHLLFAGDGELRAEAEALTRELGMQGNVHYLGNLPDIQPLLADVDLLFMPSRYEGLPMVGLEAGCAGVPVLASSIAELLEVGTPFGWTFSRDNSAEDFGQRLVALRDDRMAMRKKAQQVSGAFRARYGIDRCAREYLTAIQSLLDLCAGAVSRCPRGEQG